MVSIEAVARSGLAAEVAGGPVLDLARELADIATQGLRRIGHAGEVDSDESIYVDPVHEVIARGKSPGQVVLEQWEGPWERSFQSLIDFARF